MSSVLAFDPIAIEPMGTLRHLLAARPVIITIDGPAAVGKGTAAKRLADSLDLQVLDTGKMYRAATVVALDAGVGHQETTRLIDLVRSAKISFDWSDADAPAVLAFGRTLGHRIRSAKVDERVSLYAGVPELRLVLIEEQRRIAREHPRLVCDGRDQGAIVFKDQAGVKFYLDASEEVRARRDLARHGNGAPTPDELAARVRAIRTRDSIDRENGALCIPSDAIHVRTDTLTPEGVVASMHRAIAERLLPANPA